MDLLGELAEPFERLTPAAASTLLERHYGIESSELTRLDTERDDSFRVTTRVTAGRADAAPRDYVLKVAHPDDDPLLVNLQSAAMSFAAELEPELPLQSLVLSVEGEVEPVVEHGGRERVARVLTWLPGIPLGLAARPTGDQLELLGTTLGRLTSALSTFDHPGAHREMAWDVGRFGLIRDLLGETPMPEVVAAFDLYDRVVVPLSGELPQQVIHNDFHLGNILVDPASANYVTGVIDFGDSVHTARIADLAVAHSYLVVPGAVKENELARFTRGYESRVRLTDAERAVLPALTAARIAQRILVNSALERGNPDDRGSAIGAAETNRVALGALLERM